MFNNRFNSTHKDSLVEAVRQAQQDGETRRQAEAYVNEQFGVYSRNAVVREDLAAYDAAIEEAYKCMKEGKPLDPVGREDKDIDNDGDHDKSDKYLLNRRKAIGKAMGKRMEEGAMNSDVVGGGAVTKDNKPVVSSTAPKVNTSGPSASDKAGLAAKIGAMREATIDEKYRDAPKKDDVNRRKRDAVAMKIGHNNPEDRNDKYYRPVSMLKHGRKLMRAGVTKEETIDEAAYSAKAARKGKDIGKPGKMFAQIAAKASEKYGSEERGKKVAGAILKKIRAEHVKEQVGQVSFAPAAKPPGAVSAAPKPPGAVSAAPNRNTYVKTSSAAKPATSSFGSAFAAARKAGQSTFSMGGKSYTTQMKGEKPASTTSSTPAGQAGLKGPEADKMTTTNPSVRWKDPVTAGKTADKPAASTPASTPAPVTTSAKPGTAASASMDTPSKNTQNPDAAAGNVSWKETPKQTAASNSMDSTSTPKMDPGAAENKARASGAPLKESVQVGANRYRIV